MLGGEGVAVLRDVCSMVIVLLPCIQFYYSVRVQSLNESVLNTFSNVTPSTDLILPGETESKSVMLLLDRK